ICFINFITLYPGLRGSIIMSVPVGISLKARREDPSFKSKVVDAYASGVGRGLTSINPLAIEFLISLSVRITQQLPRVLSYLSEPILATFRGTFRSEARLNISRR